MLVVHVHVHVTPGDVEAFLAESRRNAQASLEEPGVRRFDVLQDESDPKRNTRLGSARNRAGTLTSARRASM